jgi:flavin reductase (DIM6/NTAB) family NADH-FMN oxidoreductase RutF
MPSAQWLGHRCMIGLAGSSQTTQNLLRTKTCVLNFPTEDMAPAVNELALTTGSGPVPEWKKSVGYVHVKDKFARAGLTLQESEVVPPPRIKECPVQMEAELVEFDELMGDMPDLKKAPLALELKILRVHVENKLRLEGHENRVDAEKLRPLIMAFQVFFGMRRGRVEYSKLAGIGEENYRGLTGMVINTERGANEK